MGRLLGWVFKVLVVDAMAAVTKLLSPRRGREPRIEQLNSLRTWAGLAALAVIVHANLTDPHLHGTLIGFLNSPYTKVGLAIACFLPAGAVLVAKAGPGQRVRVAGAAAKPLLIAVAVTITPLVILALAGWRYRDNAAMTGLDRLWFLLILLAGLSLLPAALRSLYLGVKFQFRASDVHPFLPALVAGFVAAVTAATSMVQLFGPGTTLDRFVSWSSLFGGLVVLGLSYYEFTLLRDSGVGWTTDHGIGPDRHLLATDVQPREWAPRLVIPLLMVLFSSSIHLLAPSATAASSPRPPAAARPASTTAASGRSSAPKQAPRPAPKQAPRAGLLHPAAFDVPATAPPNHDAAGHPVTFSAVNLGDGRLDTAWRAAGDLTGRSIVIRFNRPVTITAVALVPGYAKIDPTTRQSWFTENRRITSVRWAAQGVRAVTQDLKSIPEPQRQAIQVTTTRLTLTITGTTAPGARDYTAISEIQLFGYQR